LEPVEPQEESVKPQ
jgi:hypothetical protein